MKKTLFALLALFTLVTPRPSAAQGFITPFIGFDFSGDAQCPEISGCEDKTTNVGVAIGKLGSVVGFEEEFSYAKDFFGSAPGLSSNVLTVMSNIVIGPKISVVRPYVVGGLGLMKSNVEFTPTALLSTTSNSFGWDLGGGLIVGSRHIGVRGDIRYFHSFKDLELLGFPLSNTKLDFGRATVGLFLGF